MCRKAKGKGDYTVQNMKDCSAAIAMIPALHDVHFKDILHLGPHRSQPARFRGTFTRRPPPQRYGNCGPQFLLPAAFRAGGCLLHIHPTQGRLGYKESLNPGWKLTPTSEDFKKIWPQVKQAAKMVLAHCNHAKPEQNFGWVLSKAPLGNKRFLEYRAGITGVPRGLHPESRFPEKQLIDVKLEAPFDTFHELYQEGGIWDGDWYSCEDYKAHWDSEQVAVL